MTTAGSNGSNGTGGTDPDAPAAGAESSQGGTGGSGGGSGTGQGAGDGQNGGQGGTGTGAGSGTGEGDQGGTGDPANTEAATYRRRLRETETERDGLRERLERHQQREIERVAGEELSAPGDLLALGGKQLAELLAENGDVDADAVRAIARELTTARPGLRSVEAARRGGGIGGGRIPAGKASGSSWGDALRGQR